MEYGVRVRSIFTSQHWILVQQSKRAMERTSLASLHMGGTLGVASTRGLNWRSAVASKLSQSMAFLTREVIRICCLRQKGKSCQLRIVNRCHESSVANAQVSAFKDVLRCRQGSWGQHPTDIAFPWQPSTSLPFRGSLLPLRAPLRNALSFILLSPNPCHEPGQPVPSSPFFLRPLLAGCSIRCGGVISSLPISDWSHDLPRPASTKHKGRLTDERQRGARAIGPLTDGGDC